MTSPLIQALIAHFDSVFEAPNGDYATILESLASVSADQALWRPAPGRNSIWMIVEHLITSKEWQIQMLETGQASSPDWVEPAGDEASWQAEVERLRAAHLRLKATLEQVADEDLLALETPVPGRTLLELILSAGPAHEAHHGGQIDYLKDLQVQ